MATYNNIIKRAQEIKSATEAESITAPMVGGTIEDLAVNSKQNAEDIKDGKAAATALGDRVTALEESGGGTVPQELLDRVDALEEEVFPLKAAIASSNAGTYETGTSVTPVITLAITRKSADVAESATVSCDGATVSEDHKTVTGEAISTGSETLIIKVSQGGQTAADLKASYVFTNYRYRGAIDEVPDDYPTAIKALSTKELSTASTLGSTALAADKYYLFAVKGTPTLVCRHAATDAIVDAVTGTCAIAQENDETVTNTYTYILVPASASAWNFKITNS